MFLLKRMAGPLPKKPSPKQPEKASPDDQFLAEYLVARRTNQRVDKDWEKVHQRHRSGKKRFKSMVRKTLFLERLRAMGLTGEGGVNYPPAQPVKTEARDIRKPSSSTIIPKRDRTLTREERELQEKREREINEENTKKKELRERYILENSGGIPGSAGSTGNKYAKRKSRKLKKYKKKVYEDSEFDDIRNMEKTNEELAEEQKMSEPDTDHEMEADDTRPNKRDHQEKVKFNANEKTLNKRTISPDTIDDNENNLKDKSSFGVNKNMKTRDKSLEPVRRENNYSNVATRVKDNRQGSKEDLAALRSPNLLQTSKEHFEAFKSPRILLSPGESLASMKNHNILRSPKVSPLHDIPRSQTVATVGGQFGVMPMPTPVKKRSSSEEKPSAGKGVKKTLAVKKLDDKKGKKLVPLKRESRKGQQAPVGRKDDKRGLKPPPGKKDDKKSVVRTPRTYTVPALRM